jgi:hypothetical protein
MRGPGPVLVLAVAMAWSPVAAWGAFRMARAHEGGGVRRFSWAWGLVVVYLTLAIFTVVAVHRWLPAGSVVTGLGVAALGGCTFTGYWFVLRRHFRRCPLGPGTLFGT